MRSVLVEENSETHYPHLRQDLLRFMIRLVIVYDSIYDSIRLVIRSTEVETVARVDADWRPMEFEKRWNSAKSNLKKNVQCKCDQEVEAK